VRTCSRNCGRTLAGHNKSGVCAVCIKTPKSALKDAAVEVLAEIGPCEIAGNHHVNAIGARREPCSVCALWKALESP
jgi:hypothetical protein